MNKYTLTLMYLAAIVLANLSVAHFGPASTVVNAFVFIALNLVTRDKLHDIWGKNVARNMGLLILAGGAVSYALNAGAGRIALASVVAFLISESMDALVYSLMHKHPFLARSNGSNVAGAAFDSVLFPVLAFGGFPVFIILGQFAAKVLGGFIWSLILAKRAPVREALGTD